MDGGRLSVNLASYQNSLQNEANANSAEKLLNLNEDILSAEQNVGVKKISEKQAFDAEVKRKKSEWRKVMRFMKKNPETLLGVAHQESSNVSSPTSKMLMNAFQTYETTKHIQTDDFGAISSLLKKPPQHIGLVKSSRP